MIILLFETKVKEKIHSEDKNIFTNEFKDLTRNSNRFNGLFGIDLFSEYGIISNVS